MKKSQKLPKDFDILKLQRGQVLLMSVRKIHNLDENAAQDWKAQIMCAEHIDNPYRPVNPTSLLNEGDPRFTGNRPRRGWTTVEPSQWDKHFSGTGVTAAQIEKLQFSSVTQEDVDSIQDLKEGTHFLTLNILNPALSVGEKELELHVRIIESLTQRNENQPQKVNPAVNINGEKRKEGEEAQPQTQYGDPIYTQSTLEFNNEDGTVKPSIFLVSDQMIKSHKEGRLILPQSAILAYQAGKAERAGTVSNAVSDATAVI